MKKLLIASLLLLVVGVGAQQPAPPTPQAAPDIPFDVQDVIKMPENLYLGEVAGVALNSKRHIFVYTRTGADDGSTILEPRSARIFEFNPDGSEQKVYAWGIRNAVGIAFRPSSNELWMSTNERDELGEDLPPDYISSVRPNGFYGWPWFYLGNHVDPRTKENMSILPAK